MGVGPTPQAWEARILPMNYTRINILYNITFILSILIVNFIKIKNLILGFISFVING